MATIKGIKKRTPKIDLDAMEQTDGALTAPLTVDDMTGEDNKYTTTDVNEYVKQIKAMSDADLHDHSVKMGVTPIAYRERLEDRLEREFAVRASKKVYQPRHIQFSPEAMERQQRLMQGRY